MQDAAYGGGHIKVRYTKNATFCERMAGALVGAGFGVVLILCATGLLFWNEVNLTLTLTPMRSLKDCLNVSVLLFLSPDFFNSVSRASSSFLFLLFFCLPFRLYTHLLFSFCFLLFLFSFLSLSNFSLRLSLSQTILISFYLPMVFSLRRAVR